jgi:hypothetical protein
MGRLSYTCEAGLHTGAELWSSQMTAVARVLSRAAGAQGETFQTVAIFCGVGPVVSLLLLLSGLNSSAGFF